MNHTSHHHCGQLFIQHEAKENLYKHYALINYQVLSPTFIASLSLISMAIFDGRTFGLLPSRRKKTHVMLVLIMKYLLLDNLDISIDALYFFQK